MTTRWDDVGGWVAVDCNWSAVGTQITFDDATQRRCKQGQGGGWLCWKIGGRRLQIFLFRRQRRRRHSVEKTAELGSCVRAINVFFFFFKKSLLSDVSVERRAPVFGSVPLSPHRHDRPPYNITPVGRSVGRDTALRRGIISFLLTSQRLILFPRWYDASRIII